MSLMAWFRKNNKKLMAFVVIGLMIVFTIQPVMDYLNWRKGGGKNVFARYNNNKKISYTDRVWAQKQLEILKLLKLDLFLRPMDPRYVPSQDLQSALLGEVLFAERASAADTIGYVRQLVRREGLEISDKQINGIYERTYTPDIYWMLLTSEAHFAGVQIPLEMAKSQLEAVAPRMQKEMTYPKLIGAIMQNQGVSEEQVLETFADLTGILEYAKIMCISENRTAQEDLLETDWEQQTLDVNYVNLSSSAFAENVQAPKEEKIEEQFENYKGFFRSDVNESNPYGFGYKLPDRVRLEYIAVRMDDVASTIPQPTQQEMEEYYQQNLSRPPITQMVPSDPNDPNSQMTTRIRSYAEVAGLISRIIYQKRVDLKTGQILSEAKSITEANVTGLESEETRSKIGDEEIRRLSGDYEKTAADLGEKHKTKICAGKTGLLSAVDIQSDKNLGMLYLEGAGFANIGLARLVFAVEPLKVTELGPVDVRPPRLYENIGPLKDTRELSQSYAGSCMLLVRVIEAQKAETPQSVNQKLDRRTLSFENKAPGDVNTVKETVVQDLKNLAGMDKAGKKAEELVKLAAGDGWDNALEKLNKYYANKIKSEANETPETFTLQKRAGIRRVPPTDMLVLESRYKGDPLSREMLEQARKEQVLIDNLYSLVPEDANVLTKPAVLEYKPGMGYYCIKDLVIHRMALEQYDRDKGNQIIRDEYKNAQELAVAFYTPENIIKRMNFQLVQERPSIPAEANNPAPAEGNETTVK